MVLPFFRALISNTVLRQAIRRERPVPRIGIRGASGIGSGHPPTGCWASSVRGGAFGNGYIPALPHLQPPPAPGCWRASPGVATSFSARGHRAGIRCAASLAGSRIEPVLLNPAAGNSNHALRPERIGQRANLVNFLANPITH